MYRPAKPFQKGELAVDLDGLKLYTSTNGTDVVGFLLRQVTDGAWSANDGYIQIADEPNGGYAVTVYDDGEETTCGVLRLTVRKLAARSATSLSLALTR